MKCTNCQAELKPGADFCDNCGAQAPPQASGNIPTKVSPVGTLSVPKYREYETFALICAFAPFGLVVCILIAMNGDIYKQDKTNKQFLQIDQKLKTTTMIAGGAINFVFYLLVLAFLS